MIQDIDEINVNLSDNNSIDISIDNDNSISVSEGTPTDIAQIMHNEEIRIANENERISNETQRIANEEAREDYITDLKQRVLDGDFNGQDGHDGVDGQDGFSPVANVSKSGDTATITITDKNGTTTSTISDGVDGQDGTDGVDGYSPTVTMSKQGKITTLTITDKNGEHTTEIKDGQDGSGTGDMLKATYDTNDNGIVDNAEKVNNHTVQSDVPANAVFTDTTYTAGTGISISTENVISNTQTSAAWGNITGTLSNQTDLQNALNSKQDIKPTRLTDTSVGTQANPYILDTMNPGYYFIETPTGSTRRYFKLTSASTAITISNNAGGDGYGMYLYIPNAIDVSSLSDNDIVFYVDRNTVSSSGSISGGLSCYVYKSSANSKLYADTTKGYFKSYGTTITGSAQTWSGVKTFSSVPVCATAPTNDSDLANKKYVDDNKFSGNYNDLSNKPTIPSKTSDLSNDSNFISTSNTSGLIKNDGTIDTTSYSTFSGSYTDLSNKPTIPDELADLSDDSTHRVVTDTEKTTWNGKQAALVSGTNIKTINNTSILGSGNIDVGADIPQQDTAPSNPSEDDLWIDTDEPGIITSNKMMLVIGDSFSNNAQSGTPLWYTYVSRWHGLTVYTTASDGMGYATGNNSFLTQLQTANNDSTLTNDDVKEIYIVGGLNDLGNGSLTAANFETAVINTLEYAEEHFGNALIYVVGIFPFQWYNFYSGNACFTDNLRAKTFQAKLSSACITSDTNRVIFKNSQYFGLSTYGYFGEANAYNQRHPSALGEKMIAQFIQTGENKFGIPDANWDESYLKETPLVVSNASNTHAFINFIDDNSISINVENYDNTKTLYIYMTGLPDSNTYLSVTDEQGHFAFMWKDYNDNKYQMPGGVGLNSGNIYLNMNTGFRD